jgi:serine/threonine protein kinase
MNESADREASIYSEAQALPARERAAYLDEACGGDSALRQRIEELLAGEEEADTFFDVLERETRSSLNRAAEAPGKRIDAYFLHEQIGEGGCGVVYRAEQERPVQREVALKIIKLGMDTQQVVARFEAERQALALMDHPHIARVLDAGATETGRPYFVMELVRGKKITHYCDEHRLSVRERLDLFIQVCRAIQHAHQKGVIHRDIKPSNVLVSMHEGAAFPKVIDFGVAKATQGRLTNQTVFTGAELFIGTPAYMSPEQARRGGFGVDTRSDLYSLGVLLYELLTSQTPFESKALLALDLDGMRRTILEEEPARPSLRLSALALDELSDVAARRKTVGQKLVTAVRGDLDWIVIKALEKEPARRYGTVSGLIRDIERHLASEPVNARPPTFFYQCGKAFRRNRLAVSAGVSVLASLVLGLGVATWMFLREKEARRLAQAATEKQEALRIEAEKEAFKSRELAESLQRLLHRLGMSVATNRDELGRLLSRLKAVETTQPENAVLLRERVYFYGCAGRYSEAGADLERLLVLTPNDSEVCHWRTATLLYAREYGAYREHCRQSLQRFKNTKDFVTAERIAKDSLMLPQTDLDMETIDSMLSTALSAGPGNSNIDWFRLAKGMAEYRKGNLDHALEWLGKITLGRSATLDSQTLAVMAMAAHRANRAAEATALLNRANKLIASRLTGDSQLYPLWFDQIFADALLYEAQAVLSDEKVENLFAKDPKG